MHYVLYSLQHNTLKKPPTLNSPQTGGKFTHQEICLCCQLSSKKLSYDLELLRLTSLTPYLQLQLTYSKGNFKKCFQTLHPLSRENKKAYTKQICV